MISYQQVFKEIERQLRQAQQTNDVQAMRESLAAIQSLSTIALGSKEERYEQPVPKQVPMPQLTAQPQTKSLTSLDATPLQEEDGANGSSLFDF